MGESEFLRTGVRMGGGDGGFECGMVWSGRHGCRWEVESLGWISWSCFGCVKKDVLKVLKY